MSDLKFEVVIVGGGPAGSAAARTLSQAGVDVCVIDRSVFPRDKLCGGLLTLRSKKAFQKIFNEDWRAVIQATAYGAQFYFKEKLLNSVTDYKEICFTCRNEFDAFLLELAKQSGAKVLLGKEVRHINIDQSFLMLSDETKVSFDILIGADGVNSLVARSIFGESFSKDKIGLGLEMEIPLLPDVKPITNPEIYFGLLDWGYGWVFPKRTTLTVGVGGLLKKSPRMREDFESFLQARFGRVPPHKIKGHFIPFGDFRRVPGKGNVLLCGDAAGLVEPITGEGIAFAMLSGFYAAEGIKESLVKSKPALDCYVKRYETIATAFRQADKLRHLLFPRTFQRLFSKVLPRTKSIPRRQMDVMADDMSYRDYTFFLMKKSITGPVKSLFRV